MEKKYDLEVNKSNIIKCSKDNINKMTAVINEQRKQIGDSMDNCCVCSGIIVNGAFLKCEHIMCIECFLIQSRKTNKCKICQEEFSGPVKENKNIKDEKIDAMIEDLFNPANGTPVNYFNNAMMNIKMRGFKESKKTLHWYMKENARIIGKKVIQWYKEN